MISATPMAAARSMTSAAHAVTVAEAVRNVKAGFAARHLDGLLQNDDRDGAVDVVIAIDQDFLFGLDGRFHSRDGIVHAGEQRGVMQVIEIGSQKPAGGGSVGDAAARAARRR